MADLKELDSENLVDALAKATEQAIDMVRRTAQESMRAVLEVAQARESLTGKQASDLIAHAALAEVGEYDVAGGEFQGVEFSVGGSRYAHYYSAKPGNPVKRGRYRALFLLLKVD